jgi:PIN domain nuclease of toxin-antitoxin system
LIIALGKLESSLDEILDKLDISGFSIIQIESTFLRDLIDLPQIHKDPFDRLMIVTAKHEDMTLITADETIPMYDVRCVW